MDSIKRNRAIDTSLSMKYTKAHMSNGPSASYDFNGDQRSTAQEPSALPKSSMQFQMPSYLNRNSNAYRSTYSSVTSPNRSEIDANSLVYPLKRTTAASGINAEGSLISKENSHVINANQILNRSNCELKQQLKQLQQELDSYKDSKAAIKELKEYTDYLNNELSLSSQHNQELTSYSQAIELQLAQITEENVKLKSMLQSAQEEHQLLLKANEEFKATCTELKAKQDASTESAELLLREKEQVIIQLSNSCDDLNGKNDSMSKTLKDYEELNRAMKRTIDIFSQKESSANAQSLKDSLQAKEEQLIDAKEKIAALIEEKKRIERECCDKDVLIGSKQREIEEKDRLYDVIDRLKEDQDVFIKKMSTLYEVIGDRDKTIEELKSSYEVLNIALMNMSERSGFYQEEKESGALRYKQLYEDEVKRNELLVKALDESKEICKRSAGPQEQMKSSHEDSIKTKQMQSSIIEARNGTTSSISIKDNSLKGSQSTTLEQQPQSISQCNKSYALYSICKDKLIGYDFTSKKFKLITPLSYAHFLSNYQLEGSATYNTLEGLFVLTGPIFDQVYYYSQKTNSMSLILQLGTNHSNGSMVMDDSAKALIFLSGSQTAAVDQFDFQSHKQSSLPSMLQARANASYCLIDRKLYGFFGYDFKADRISDTIERLDLDECKQWEQVAYTSADNIRFAFAYHSVAYMGGDMVLLLGGIRENEEKFNEKIITMDLKKNVIKETDSTLPSIQENKFYLFEANSHFNLMLRDDDSFCMAAMDNMSNVHVIDSDFRYEVIVFAQEVEN